jgi:hypothetical protein
VMRGDPSLAGRPGAAWVQALANILPLFQLLSDVGLLLLLLSSFVCCLIPGACRGQESEWTQGDGGGGRRCVVVCGVAIGSGRRGSPPPAVYLVSPCLAHAQCNAVSLMVSFANLPSSVRWSI